MPSPLETLYQGASQDAMNDTRFQFEVIKQLSESLRAVQSMQTTILERQGEILERLTRIEAHETAAELAALKNRVTILEAAEHRREGAQSVLGWIAKSPVVGWLVAAGAAIFAFTEGTK